ncbi:hypothetical protein [Parasitella parasitica]|uniref:Uncharacterized protein n=1 Tax=Parasitella parasitica TaxID=35722 RepID=A0A0B7NVS9_9FUNG|nr:hypothetical protein [Parasitella parasitica]
MCYTYYNSCQPAQRGPLQTNYWRLKTDVEGFSKEVKIAYNPELENLDFVEFVQSKVEPLGLHIDSIVIPSYRMGSCFNYKIKNQNQYKAATGMGSIQSDLWDPNRGAMGTIILDEKRMEHEKRNSDSGYSSNDSDAKLN